MTLCQFKRQYPSQRITKQAIRDRERENPTLRGTLRAYRCNVCGLWHMTSQLDRKESAA